MSRIDMTAFWDLYQNGTKSRAFEKSRYLGTPKLYQSTNTNLGPLVLFKGHLQATLLDWVCGLSAMTFPIDFSLDALLSMAAWVCF